jgi:deoxyribodipyrimidine photo-lyase
MDRGTVKSPFAAETRISSMSKANIKARLPIIVCFRFDLRLHDHRGMADAVASGRPIVPVYIYDEALTTRPLGAASKWWLHQSLHALDEDIRARGARLIVAKGDTKAILTGILDKTEAKTVSCAHVFDPKTEALDKDLADHFKARHVDFERHNATLLTTPNWVRTRDGRPFRVFTPFHNALRDQGVFEPHQPDELPSGDWRAPDAWPKSLRIDDLGLNETRTASGQNWAAGFDRFKPGERGARAALRGFVRQHLETYAGDRDRPDKGATSHLSPHLRFGEISPQRVLYEVDEVVKNHRHLVAGAGKFRAELAWREFCYGLLEQQPRLDRVNFREDFDGFRWRDDDKGFRAWCRGETGYPLVDAGMRELWRTGYMHNRVRMVCASFLVKHLLIDWRRGERWFWDCLLDADPANNPANWQWVAGCGADAAPYFRIFNPMTQADKFDPAGLYRTRYIQGYKADSHSSKQRDLFGGKAESPLSVDYPQPIVEHAFARERALEAYKNRKPS